MKRKIIEIYVEENKENDEVSFDFERIEDTEIANSTMKMLLQVLSCFKNEDDEIVALFEESEE